MNALRGFLGCVLLSAAACTGPGASGSPPRSESLPSGKDSVRLTNGEVIQGRILEESAGHVSVDTGDRVVACPRGTIYQVSYSAESYRARTAPLKPALEKPRAAGDVPSTWYPRTGSRDLVEQREILWYDAHPFKECVGEALAAECLRIPELTLFAEPGGKIVLHDPKRWGYHAHVFAGDRLHKPAGKPGLAIEVPKEEAQLPDAVAFVSPSQEMLSGDDAKRASYAPPDALYARVRSVTQAAAMLAAQPFGGGKPQATPTGKLWAFALPRNSSQFAVYLFDAERRHGEILKGAFAAYGDTVLAADFAVDVVGADGVTIGRVLVVPFPDGLSADGPAPDPVSIYAGPAQDPSPVTTVPVPPRQAIQLPARAPSTRADILVSHYEVSRGVPETIVLAHGVGRPSAGVKVVARELTPEKPDEVLKIDLAALPEDRFPAVVWLYQRRTFAWRNAGGYRPQVAPLQNPAPRGGPLTKVKRNAAIPHVLPLYFQGPKQVATTVAADPGAGVAGGMASALMQDALAREAGSMLPSISLNPSATVPSGGSGSPIVNQTYLQVTVPPPGGIGGPAGGLVPPVAGSYLNYHPGGYGSVTDRSVIQGDPFAPLAPQGHRDAAGNYWSRSGQQVLNNSSESRNYYGGSSLGELQFVDPDTGAGVHFKRRSGP